MINKESLLPISSLKLAGKIENMTDHEFNSYVQALNLFVDGFPVITARLKTDLNMKAYDKLAKDLANVSETLHKLHADDMARECRQKLNVLNGANSANMDHDDFEVFLENFILNVASLSIDIQMAAHRSKVETRSATAHRGKMETQSYDARTSLKNPGILAVDNAAMFLSTLKKLLKDVPCELNCMTSCDEALRFLQTNRPDLFLLDVDMPDMDGYELARRIRGSGHKAPIIFITAHSAREYVDKAIEVGAQGVLMKPLRIKQLHSKIKEFI